jgi:hypothetical protein
MLVPTALASFFLKVCAKPVLRTGFAHTFKKNDAPQAR